MPVLTVAQRWFWIDVAATLLVSALVALAAVRLLRDVARALRTGVGYAPDDDA